MAAERLIVTAFDESLNYIASISSISTLKEAKAWAKKKGGKYYSVKGAGISIEKFKV